MFYGEGYTDGTGTTPENHSGLSFVYAICYVSLADGQSFSANGTG